MLYFLKEKTSDDLRRELEQLFTEEEEGIRAKLVKGLRVKHELQDDTNSETITSHEGEIIQVSETTVTIQYAGYDNSFAWSIEELVEDFEQGDLTILDTK